MYKLCKTEQAAVRQRELERGMMKYMALHRYEDITVSCLCEYLQIPRKSFYRYFSSKEGALYALIDHHIMDFSMLVEDISGTDEKTLYQNLEVFFLFWREKYELLDVLEKSGISSTLMIRFIISIASMSPLPPDQLQAVNFAATGLMLMVLRWHHEGFQQTPGEMADISYRLLSTPLADQMYGTFHGKI